MHMKVTKEQFVLDGDKRAHTPTGATFWLGDKDIVTCEQGRLKLNTGDDYDLDELKQEAWRIMVARRRSSSGIIDSHIHHQRHKLSLGYRRAKPSIASPRQLPLREQKA
jgi:hypothetical protein